MFGTTLEDAHDFVKDIYWTSTTSKNIVVCFFCHRDLTLAMSVNYVSEGPICSMCLAQMGKKIPLQ